MKAISELGFDLKERREELGLSQSKVSLDCGVSVYTYQLWERGNTRSINEERFDKLKEALSDKTD